MGHSSPEITMQRYILGYIAADDRTMRFFKKDNQEPQNEHEYGTDNEQILA